MDRSCEKLEKLCIPQQNFYGAARHKSRTSSVSITLQLDIAQTVGIAAVLLVVGEFIKQRVSLLSRCFIPGLIIGGMLFSLIALVGHQTGAFSFQFYDNMRAFFFLLLVFFTTIGFSASFGLLKKGGVGVVLFLAAAVGLVLTQNTLGVALAAAMGVHPLIGMVAGSIALTGGHSPRSHLGRCWSRPVPWARSPPPLLLPPTGW